MNDDPALLALLDGLAQTLETLLQSGLSAASNATGASLELAFRQASERRLLRLGSTLRLAAAEVKRFVDDDPQFSQRRYLFFINRAWLLANALRDAIAGGDQEARRRLLLTPQTQPLRRLRAAALGVNKKHVPGVFCAFDVYLHPLDVGPPLDALTPGDCLVWSCVFPLKPDASIAPETFLNLDQPQRFRPRDLLSGAIEFFDALIDVDGRRITLQKDSRVERCDNSTDFGTLPTWRPRQSLDALREYRPQPLDLETDLQRPVILDDWSLSGPEQSALHGRSQYRVDARGLRFAAVAADSDEGRALKRFFDKPPADTPRRPLFGLLHYELCRLVLQPLALLGNGGAKHLMLEDTGAGAAELLRALNKSH